jgi:hypothetical protein
VGLLLVVVFTIPVLREIMGFSVMGIPQLVAGAALAVELLDEIKALRNSPHSVININ